MHTSTPGQGFANGDHPERDGAGQTGTSSSEAEIRIAVLGIGHVGLPTALGFAELGFDVVVADIDAAKLELIRNGVAPFYEPGMQALLQRHLQHGTFHVTSNIGEAINWATTLFICVGTPQRESGEADLKHIEHLARIIASNLNGFKLIVEKSTVPAVTGDWIRRTVMRYALSGNGSTHKRALNFDLASNPEFLQEGKALEGFFHPDRIICGVSSERARELLSRIYAPLRRPIVFTDVTTAELIKHAANAFLATKISFINMVADLCEAVGADVTQVAEGIGADRRIGVSFLSAGIGFGGYCLPKDLRAFSYLAEQHNVDSSILRAVELTNTRCVERFLAKVRRALWITEDKTIGILGLSFKSGTDDIRESPALKIAEALLNEGACLRVYDPKAMPEASRVMASDTSRVVYCQHASEVAQGAHAILLLTDWDEFRTLSLRRLRRRMRVPILLDGRNLFEPQEARNAGFEYFCVGRASTSATATQKAAHCAARDRGAVHHAAYEYRRSSAPKS